MEKARFDSWAVSALSHSSAHITPASVVQFYGARLVRFYAAIDRLQGPARIDRTYLNCHIGLPIQHKLPYIAVSISVAALK